MTPRRLGQRPEDKGDTRVDAVGTETRCFAHRFLDAVADDSQKAMNRATGVWVVVASVLALL